MSGLTSGGSSSAAWVAVRVVPRAAPTLEQLERAGSLAPQVAAVLRALVHARASVLVTGATGAGKTTLLASLLALVHKYNTSTYVEPLCFSHPVEHCQLLCGWRLCFHLHSLRPC